MIRNITGDNADGDGTRCRALLPEDGEDLRTRFHAGLPLGSARLQLERFCSNGTASGPRRRGRLRLQVNMPTNFWKQWIGRQPALEVQVHLDRPNRPAHDADRGWRRDPRSGCSRKRRRAPARDGATPARESPRRTCSSTPRSGRRIACFGRTRSGSTAASRRRKDAIECRGKDISRAASASTCRTS